MGGRFVGGRKGINAAEIQAIMLEEGVTTSYHKANRARLKAEATARGTSEEGYKRLYSYFHMLKQSNPGSHTQIVRDDNQRFKFCFWALAACIRAIPNLMKVCHIYVTFQLLFVSYMLPILFKVHTH